MTTADQKAWEGFVKGNWCDEIDVRDFIQLNYTPYEGDASFLAGPTEKTMRVWNTLEEKYLSEERKVRILDVDTDTPADIDAFKPGYICEDDNVIVGLQTDAPLKRAMMPNGGWRMVETAIHEAGKEYNPEVKKIFTKYRKTHNDAVFDIYTPRIRAARSSHIITGLPDAYGRGRIIGDYRRVALYGVDHLIAEKQKDKDRYADQPFSEHWARYREEHSEQIKALKKLKNLAASYGYDISGPATNAHEAVQWTYFGYLASVKSQDGVRGSLVGVGFRVGIRIRDGISVGRRSRLRGGRPKRRGRNRHRTRRRTVERGCDGCVHIPARTGRFHSGARAFGGAHARTSRRTRLIKHRSG